ncbi:MAG: DUF4781 domain-containing protein [Myxococcaceae bacterium]|nr:DUF4781 domain-containing protein [Myxococcaceae bacterium]
MPVRLESAPTPISGNRQRLRLHKVDPQSLQPGLFLVQVKEGNSLTRIAKRTGVPLEVLAFLNPTLFTEERRFGDLIFPREDVVVPQAEALPQLMALMKNKGAVPLQDGEAVPQPGRQLSWPDKAVAKAGSQAQVNGAPAQQAVSFKPVKAAMPRAPESQTEPAAPVSETAAPIADPAKFQIVASQMAEESRKLGAHELAEAITKVAKDTEHGPEKLLLIQKLLELYGQKFGGDVRKAALQTGADIAAEEILEKLPSGDKMFEANLDAVKPSEIAKRTAATLFPKTDVGGLDRLVTYLKPTMDLADAVVARLKPEDKNAKAAGLFGTFVKNTFSFEGNQGHLEASAVKELKRRFPDAEVALLLMTPKEKLGGLSQGELNIQVSRTDPAVTLPFNLTMTEEGMLEPVARDPNVDKASGPAIVTNGNNGEGAVFRGKASKPGWVVVSVGGKTHEVATDSKGKWTLSMKDIVPTLDFSKPVEITVAEKTMEIYKLGQKAGLLYGRGPEVAAEKMRAAEGNTLGGILEKTDFDPKRAVGRIKADAILNGHADNVSMSLSIDAADAKSKRTIEFRRPNTLTLYKGKYLDQVFSGQTEAQQWEPKSFEDGVLRAAGFDPATGMTDEAIALTKEEVLTEYKGGIKKLNELHQRFGGIRSLEVTPLKVMVDQADGISYSMSVFRVENGKDAIFVDSLGKEYRSWDDYLENNTLPPDSLMTYPLGGELNLDKEGNPLIATKNAPATMDTWQEYAMYYGQYAMTAAGLAMGLAMPIGFGAVAAGVLSREALALLMMRMMNVQVGMALQQGAMGGYMAHDRYRHGQSLTAISDPEVRQMYYLGMFGLSAPALKMMQPAMKSLILKEPLYKGTNMAGRTAGAAMLFAGQTAMIAGTVEDGVMAYQDWDHMSESDKVMFFGNLGMLGGMVAVGGVRGMFDPMLQRHQFMASMRIPEAMARKAAAAHAEVLQTGSPKTAFTQFEKKETKQYIAHIEGIVATAEAQNRRMLFRDAMPNSVNAQQLADLKSLLHKLRNELPLFEKDWRILNKDLSAPKRLAMLKPPPLTLDNSIGAAHAYANAGKPAKAHTVLNKPERAAVLSKIKETLTRPGNETLPPELRQHLEDVDRRIRGNEELSTNDVDLVYKLSRAQDYTDLQEPLVHAPRSNIMGALLTKAHELGRNGEALPKVNEVFPDPADRQILWEAVSARVTAEADGSAPPEYSGFVSNHEGHQALKGLLYRLQQGDVQFHETDIGLLRTLTTGMYHASAEQPAVLASQMVSPEHMQQLLGAMQRVEAAAAPKPNAPAGAKRSPWYERIRTLRAKVQAKEKLNAEEQAWVATISSNRMGKAQKLANKRGISAGLPEGLQEVLATAVSKNPGNHPRGVTALFNGEQRAHVEKMLTQFRAETPQTPQQQMHQQMLKELQDIFAREGMLENPQISLLNDVVHSRNLADLSQNIVRSASASSLRPRGTRPAYQVPTQGEPVMPPARTEPVTPAKEAKVPARAPQDDLPIFTDGPDRIIRAGGGTETRRPLGRGAAVVPPKKNGVKVTGFTGAEVEAINAQFKSLIDAARAGNSINIDERNLLKGLQNKFNTKQQFTTGELERLREFFPNVDASRFNMARVTKKTQR